MLPVGQSDHGVARDPSKQRGGAMAADNHDGGTDIFSKIATDLMANLALAFLLALGVGILLAGQMSLFSRSLAAQATIAEKEVDYQKKQLEKLAAAKAMQQFLESSWTTALNEMTQPVDVPGFGQRAVFAKDAKQEGVKLNADILFGTGSSELMASPEAEATLGAAQRALCNALQNFAQQVADDPTASRVLVSPFDYVEVVFEGHADAVRSRRGSNWQLSTARATSLLTRFAIDENDPNPAGITACREIAGLPLLDSRLVRVIAAGRGSMEAKCGAGDLVCNKSEDRYALIRLIIRMDKVLARYQEQAPAPAKKK